MKHLLSLRIDRLFAILNWFGLPTLLIYGLCMIAWPLFAGQGDWGYVQNVWDRWQSLNVGVLAFVSSITAFNISKYNANKQREREFLASKAFLPAALSELVTYFKESALVFKTGWNWNSEDNPKFKMPRLPAEYKEVFGNCIRHADPDVGDYLSRILVWLQIHDARLRDYVGESDGQSHFQSRRLNLVSYFYRLGELQALVSNLFEFARNMGKFEGRDLNWDDFRNAYGNLDIWVDDIHIDETNNLEGFTKRRIARDHLENS